MKIQLTEVIVEDGRISPLREITISANAGYVQKKGYTIVLLGEQMILVKEDLGEISNLWGRARNSAFLAYEKDLSRTDL